MSKTYLSKSAICILTFIIAATVLSGIAAIAVTLNRSSGNIYGTEAVRVLEGYKSYQIDAKEAASRIDDLIDKVYADMNATTDSKQKHKLTMLWADLIGIHTKLYHYGRAAGYEVDEAIRKIKADQ